jgi:alpha-L-arabinofuranosidase
MGKTTAEAIQELGCGALRFPYGALADRYLWHSGDYSTATNGLVPKMVYVPSYMQSWPGINPDGTFYQDMDFDEYMELCQVQGRKSLVCVNALSYKTNPGQITYEELKTSAVEWVRYAQLKGYQVDYWQIGNEMDHHDDLQTKAEYLALYRDFAAAMKAVDPTIKVGPGILNNSNWYQPLVKDSPELTDFVSVHQYMWNWTDTISNYEDWRSTSSDYINNINTAINVIKADASKPTEIHVTETNVTGHDTAGTTNNLYKSLWMAEVLLNQAKAKYVAYSYYWGLHSPWKGTNDESAFEGDDLSVALRMDNNAFKPSAHAISLINRFLLDTFVYTDKSVNQIRTYATKSAAEDRINIILINRNDVEEEVDLNFKSLSSAWAGTRYTYTGTGPYDQEPFITDNRIAVVSGTNLNTMLPPLSMTVLELVEADPNQPLISILSPFDGERVEIGADVIVSADAGDPDGNIERVDFMLDGTLFASDSTAPYEAIAYNMQSGAHTLEAVVWDADGNSARDSVNISSAGTIVFGTENIPWQGGASNKTITVVTNGITFALTARSSGENLWQNNGGDHLAVRGGDLDARIDDGLTDGTDDDEFITFTLSVGGPIKEVELESLLLTQVYADRSRGELLDAEGNSVLFNNIEGDANNHGQNPSLNYSDQMSTLIPLSIQNVGGKGDNTWELTVVAREGVNGDTVFQVDDLSFNYTLKDSSLVTFGVKDSDTDWGKWVSNSIDATQTTATATYETNGINFSLEMTASGPLRKFSGGDGAALAVIGGTHDSRIDPAGEGTEDDEWITFKLSVSGKELEEINLNSISMFYHNTVAGIEVVDGSANSVSLTRNGGDQTQVYTAGQMSGLTPLSLSNVGGQGDNSWEMTVYARVGTMQFDDITFQYDLGSTVVVTNMGPLTIESLPGGTNLQIRWESVAGASYRLLEIGDLVSGNWQTNTAGIEATPPENTNLVSTVPAKAFFKVEVEQ